MYFGPFYSQTAVIANKLVLLYMYVCISINSEIPTGQVIVVVVGKKGQHP